MPRWKPLATLWAIAVALLIATFAFGNGDESAPPLRNAASPAADQACDVTLPARALPLDVRETSGLARGRDRADVYWTHNDAGGGPVLFGLGEDGRLRQRVAVEGARAVDWEDIEAGPCDAGSCLYVADAGDNNADRESITLYRLPEPGTQDRRVQAEAFPARYPDRPRDAEALFIHDGEPYLVTKGRHGPIALYRFPSSRRPGTLAVLEPVVELGPEPEEGRDRVTAATASPDGRRVAIVTGRELRLYDAAALVRGQPAPPLTFDTRALGLPQIEAVVVDDSGNVRLTSEGEGGAEPGWVGLRCRLP